MSLARPGRDLSAFQSPPQHPSALLAEDTDQTVHYSLLLLLRVRSSSSQFSYNSYLIACQSFYGEQTGKGRRHIRIFQEDEEDGSGSPQEGWCKRVSSEGAKVRHLN